jgi:hypothetical protein
MQQPIKHCQLIERLETEASTSELVSQLATDRKKQRLYNERAGRAKELADKLKRRNIDHE